MAAEKQEKTKYDAHALLDCRNKGDCRRLTGTVLITVVLVDEPHCRWTEQGIRELMAVQERTTEMLLDEAEAYGAALRISLRYRRCAVEQELNVTDYPSWIAVALQAAHLPEEERTIPVLKTVFGVEEAPVLFALNREGRSFAIPCSEAQGFEFAVLYRGHGDYRHELFHLFGAKDFYVPDAVKLIAEPYFFNSIMMTSGDVEVDPLTAYLIGWTEELPAQARQFLRETAWVTPEQISSSLQALSCAEYTVRVGDGTYTGQLSGGQPHGRGRIEWDDGNTYEGQWRDGLGDGYGTLVWRAAGTVYSGRWKRWAMHGEGTYRFADGTVLSGRWENNEYKGT